MSGEIENTVLRNARVDDAIVDVLVEDGVITRIEAGLTASAEEVDLDGRWLIPGLWDNHVHLSQHALVQQRLDLSSALSASEAAAIAAQALAEHGPMPEDEHGRPIPLVGNGFRDGLWEDEPNLQDLDDAGRGAPIVLVSGDLHSVWLNSAALDLYGLSAHPTGLLREDAAFDITSKINTIPSEVLDVWADIAGREAAARGVVGIVDLEMAWNLDTWLRRMDRGFDSLRVDFGIYSQDLERAIAAGYRTGQRINDLLTVGMFKVLSDGSLNTRTAYCFNPYPGLEGTPYARGMLTTPPEHLVPLMKLASDAGITPTVHAIGDNANMLVLDAYEKLGIRGRIEHAQLLDVEDIPRFAELGITASVQPEHAMDDRDVADRFWVGHTHRAFSLRSLIDAGAEVVLGSDAPVASLDPWITIAAAVGRARDGREPWHPEEAITAKEALDASVRTKVAVGEVADLAIVNVDPLTAEADSLRLMPVAGTLLGGRWTHHAL